MSVYLHNIETTVPEVVYEQQFLRDQMKEYVSDKRSIQKIIHRIYSKSGIERRHSVVNDFHANGDPRLFFQPDGTVNSPSTGDRNRLYVENAKKLFVTVAGNLLDNHPEFDRESVTHVITVSCTGFFAPGPDYEIVKQLGLNPGTERFHLGFMGCYAAFPALRMARSFCKNDEDAVVMVVCLELCSLHFQHSESADNLISASVFADGGAGALISRRSPTPGQPVLQLDRFSTSIAEQSEEDMAWTIGDTGFDMVLSTYVPDIIESNLAGAIRPLFESLDITPDAIEHWALHPGGRAILDKIEESLDLRPEQLTPSREVLSEYGNMSSATILFVLDQTLKQPIKAPEGKENVLAMAFGPGLTLESGLFTKSVT